MDRRAELEAWIARTHHTQRTLGIVLGGAAAVSIALAFWRSQVGMIGLGIVVIVAICGFWITASHVADWRTKLDQLDRPVRTVGRREP